MARRPLIDRRRVLLGAGGLVSSGVLVATAATARAADQGANAAAPADGAGQAQAGASVARGEPTAHYKDTLARLLGGAEPREERVIVDIPETVENGNIVPYRLEVESPMDESEHVTRLHLLSTANPQPQVATFHFSPLSARAVVTGRMRLAKSQDVVALAETSRGEFFIGRCPVDVDIAGCGNE